jgi:hypothetical protein
MLTFSSRSVSFFIFPSHSLQLLKRFTYKVAVAIAIELENIFISLFFPTTHVHILERERVSAMHTSLASIIHFSLKGTLFFLHVHVYLYHCEYHCGDFCASQPLFIHVARDLWVQLAVYDTQKLRYSLTSAGLTHEVRERRLNFH